MQRPTYAKLFLLFFIMMLLLGYLPLARAGVVPIEPQPDGTIIFITYYNENNEEVILKPYDLVQIDQVIINIYNVHENYTIKLEFFHAREINATSNQLVNVTRHYFKTFELKQYEFSREVFKFDSVNETEVIRILYLGKEIITFYHKTRPSELVAGYLTKGQVTQLMLIAAGQVAVGAVIANFFAQRILKRAKYVPQSLLSVVFYGTIPLAAIIGVFRQVIFDFIVENPWVFLPIGTVVVLPIALHLHNPKLSQILFEKLHVLMSEQNVEKEYFVTAIDQEYNVIDPENVKEFFIRLLGKYRKLTFLGRAEWYINDRSKTFERVYLFHEIADIKSKLVFSWKFEKVRLVVFGLIVAIAYFSGYLPWSLLGLVIFIEIKAEKGAFMVTLASTLYQEVEKVLVDLRRSVSLVNAAEAQKNRANLIEAELYVRALQLQEVREKIRIVYKRLAKKQITPEEAQKRLKKLLDEEDRLLQLMKPEEIVEEVEKEKEEVAEE